MRSIGSITLIPVDIPVDTCDKSIKIGWGEDSSGNGWLGLWSHHGEQRVMVGWGEGHDHIMVGTS